MLDLGQSSVPGFADDAVLKAVVAEMMSERRDTVTRRKLRMLGDMAGKPALRVRLEAALGEDAAMRSFPRDASSAVRLCARRPPPASARRRSR